MFWRFVHPARGDIGSVRFFLLVQTIASLRNASEILNGMNVFVLLSKHHQDQHSQHNDRDVQYGDDESGRSS